VSTLGRDCRRRFLHDRGVDVARSGHVLHGVRHRLGLPPRADPRIHAASRGTVHGADRPHTDDGPGWWGRHADHVDLRPGSKVER